MGRTWTKFLRQFFNLLSIACTWFFCCCPFIHIFYVFPFVIYFELVVVWFLNFLRRFLLFLIQLNHNILHVFSVLNNFSNWWKIILMNYCYGDGKILSVQVDCVHDNLWRFFLFIILISFLERSIYVLEDTLAVVSSLSWNWNSLGLE